MGSFFVYTVATMIGLVLILFTLPLKRFECCKKVHEFIQKKLLWNFVIRLVLEQFLKLGFGLLLQFKYVFVNKKYYGSVVNFMLAIIMTVIAVLLPFFVVIFY